MNVDLFNLNNFINHCNNLILGIINNVQGIMNNFNNPIINSELTNVIFQLNNINL